MVLYWDIIALVDLLVCQHWKSDINAIVGMLK